MDQLFIEFEVKKLTTIALKHYFDLRPRANMSLPTFDVHDEYLDYERVATMQWTGESWALIPLTDTDMSASALGAMLNEARSPYFWEISP